jgi:hypothetical protein
MRVAGIGILILAIGGIIAGTFIKPPPFVGRIPRTSLSDIDLERRALSYESMTVTDSRGLEVEREILLLGPSSRIFDPWLQLRFELDRIELIHLDGREIRVPEGTATVIWDEAAGSWHFSPERFDPDLLPNVRGHWVFSEVTGAMEPRYRSLPEGLHDTHPDRAELIDRAFPPRGGQ